MPLKLLSQSYVYLLALHPFPTRRSSDLRLRRSGGWMDQVGERLREGAAKGRLPVAPLSEQAIAWAERVLAASEIGPDRKSTRLNSSHPSISYAVFCLKKKTIRSALSLLR